MSLIVFVARESWIHTLTLVVRQSETFSMSQRDIWTPDFGEWRLPPVGPRPLVTVAPMMHGCRGSAMYLVSLHYLARANSIACIATKPTKAFDH